MPAFDLGHGLLDPRQQPHPGGGLDSPDHEAAVGVHRDLLAGGDRERLGAGTGHQGNPQRPGDDRRVRSARAAREHDARSHSWPMPRRRPGPRSSATTIDPAGRLRAAPVRQLTGATGDRPQVGGARGQGGVVEPRQRRARAARRPTAIASAAAAPACGGGHGGGHERRVGGHHPIGLDDLGVGRVTVGTQRRRPDPQAHAAPARAPRSTRSRS